MAQIKAIEDKKAFPNSNLNWIHNKLIQIVIHNTLENTKGREREREKGITFPMNFWIFLVLLAKVYIRTMGMVT